MTLLTQLSDTQLRRYYLGLDIGYREHVAAVIGLQDFASGQDRWKRAKCLHFASTRAGLDKLQAYLDHFSADPSTFFGVCEPTGGFYGATVYQYLMDRQYTMWWIENATTRHMRERIFGNIPKTDELEARVMARIGYLHEAVGEEFTLRPLRLAGADDADLLALCRDHWKLNVMVNRARNEFAQLLAVIFPELKTFFRASVSTIVPVSLLAAYPLPVALAAASSAEVAAVLKAAGGHQHARRVDELQQLARHSSGLLPDPGRAWRLAWLTDFLLTNFSAQAALDRRIEMLVTQRADYQWVAHMPYAGPAALGVILAATGDIQRFRNYRQYVAYTGYFAGLEKSQTIDRTRMSKRGNRDLKRALFQIAAPLVWFDRDDNPYKTLYQRKRAEGRAWYKAMPFVCAALARHLYHCLKFKEPYDAEKTFRRAVSSVAPQQVLADLPMNLDDKFAILEAQLGSVAG
jgi:hypothetical protein